MEIAQTYNGLSQPAKRIETRRADELIGNGPQTNIVTTATTTYYVYSTVLGGAAVTELNANGQKTTGYVYANGQRLAKQINAPWGSYVSWQHPNAGSNSWVETGTAGYAARQEMDPTGAEVGASDPYVNTVNPDYPTIKGSQPLFIDGTDPFSYVEGVTLDGMPMTQSQYNHMLSKAGVLRVISQDIYETQQVTIGGDFDAPTDVEILTGTRWFTMPDSQRKGQTQKPDEITEAIDKADQVSRTSACQTFIDGLIRKALARVPGYVNADPDSKAYLDSINSSTLMKGIRDAKHIALPNQEGPDEAAADTLQSDSRVTFYRGFYFNKVHKDIAVNEPNNTEEPTDLTQRAQTVIHEGLHLLLKEFTDEFLGEIIAKEKPHGKTAAERRPRSCSTKPQAAALLKKRSPRRCSVH